MKRLVVMVMPESVTGYVQVFKYDEENKRCIEERCGSSKDSIMVRDIEENFTSEDWEHRVSGFKQRMQELANDYPEYTFDVKEI
jgi:hypothetical protein